MEGLASQTAQQINERMSQEVVPMDELRAAVRDGRLALEGSRVTRLPGSKRVIFPQQPERSDATSWVAFDDPAEGLRAVDELMRDWPFG